MGQLAKIARERFALRNGHDKDQVWIAYQGNVYDLTSQLWLKGKNNEHWADQDLTDELKDAPHTKKVFEKFKIIGILK